MKNRLLVLGILFCFALCPVTVQPTYRSCIIVIGGGQDIPEVNVTSADQKTLDFCNLLRADGRFDVVCLDNFIYPSNKPMLDAFFCNLSITHESLFLFGISAGAVVVLDYAQKSTLFKSAIVCSAPVDYNPWHGGKQAWYWHLVNTANLTKIPLLFVLPTQGSSFSERQNITFCEQMQMYYEYDLILPKKVIMWNTVHNPLDYDPAELSKITTEWFKVQLTSSSVSQSSFLLQPSS